ncbi:GDP-mannose 4,6-dehydratase [soil metagenome]
MGAIVTGGAGFIGSHLCDALLGRGHSVTAIDDLSTGSPANLLGLLDNPRFEFIRGSVLDADLVDHAVARHDRVFHLAAAVGVHTIVDDPLDSLRTNLDGTQIVLDAARRHDRRVLLTSTSEVYGKNPADRLDENADRVLGSAMKARWSYAAAKGIDELIARTYWQEHGLRAVVVRLFNTVGPRQTGRYGMVVPRLVGQALRDVPLTVYGDGSQTRCFCHVDDIVPALVTLIDTPAAYGLAVNLGHPSEISIRDLAEVVLRLTGSRSQVQLVPYEQAYGSGYEDMLRRVPDIGRARDLIDFAPEHDLDRIVKDVAGYEPAREQLDALRWRPEGVAATAATNGHPATNGRPARNGHAPARPSVVRR